jgi:pimeloyl-ACP methyl ester carboxylesterase
VIRFDLRGFGLTGPAPDRDYRVEAYVRDTIAVLDALAIRRCVLVGNSLGGSVAWETALADRARVEALVLVDSAGYPFAATSVPLGFRAARSSVFSGLVRWVTPRFIVASSVRNVFGDPSRVSDPLVDRFYELALREGNRDALIERFRQSVAGEHQRAIATITVPTLILWGERDRLIPVDRAQQFKRDIAGSTLVVLPGLGHVPQQESPEQSLAPVRAWLDALPARGQPSP